MKKTPVFFWASGGKVQSSIQRNVRRVLPGYRIENRVSSACTDSFLQDIWYIFGMVTSRF